MAIEVETKNDIDLDHELRLNGLANILAGLAGGTVGTLSVRQTLFSFRIGARTHQWAAGRRTLPFSSSAWPLCSWIWTHAYSRGCSYPAWRQHAL